MAPFDHSEYNRLRYHRLRARYVALLGGVCVDCGASEGLEFDHVDPSSKSFEVARLLSYAQSVVIAELQKCVLRCQSCHVAKGKRNGEQGQVPHGGGASGKNNCPCELCKARKAAWKREWRRVNGRYKSAGIPGVD